MTRKRNAFLLIGEKLSAMKTSVKKRFLTEEKKMWKKKLDIDWDFCLFKSEIQIFRCKVNETGQKQNQKQSHYFKWLVTSNQTTEQNKTKKKINIRQVDNIPFFKQKTR